MRLPQMFEDMNFRLSELRKLSKNVVLDVGVPARCLAGVALASDRAKVP
jgi:hypothetical protein